MPGGVAKVIEIGKADHKFSLGSFSPDFINSSFWVILLYGFFINLNNFGMDQNYIQRYHTASSNEAASKSIWLCVWLYVPASLLFFVIGSCLYAYYQVNPELVLAVKHQVAVERLPVNASATEILNLQNSLLPADYGDKIMPHFMVNKIPMGLVGLIVSAILSAAMSTISSGMNASATVFSVDIYKRYFKPNITEKQNLSLLHIATIGFGLLGMISGIAMIGVKSILDVWWELSGIFAAGMLGLFLLGVVSKQTKNHEAILATIIGIAVIVWMTLSSLLPPAYETFRNPLHKNMIIVVGTLTIFLVGVLLTKIKKQKIENS